jgi:4-hydroxysphinganine ceramide fatty acyl 2-hydroxylase
MSKRVRAYSAEEVAKHNSAGSCWITRAGKVYDVTAFLQDHPGGDDLILQHAGKDVEDIMRDVVEHEHSDSAYDMLQDYAIGKIRTKEMIGNNSA